MEKDKLQMIADHYGLKSQLHQLAEECSELAVASSHSARTGNITINLIEEIADVQIMIEQIIHLAKIERKDIRECIDYKLDRQMKRIEKEENNG